MLYLITGANGAGKTLNALKWVSERASKESRPVCHNGRFEPVPGGPLDAWKKIDFKDWQQEPDGTIFLIDECHNDMPTRAASSAVPEPIKALAEHRRRGMDFYLITQHPQNVDSFVRRLIGSPGWHRHLKRTFGAELVSVLEWSAVNSTCERPGSGKSGTVTTQGFPKDVYGWYRSASLHTGKRHIPKKIWLVVASVLLVPLLIWFAVATMTKPANKAIEQKPTLHDPGRGAAAPLVVKADMQQDGFKSFDRYVSESVPRVPGLPHTAPRYDQATAPKRVPVPAACVEMASKGCKCYTQQGTLISDMVPDLCRQIVKVGYFIDFEPDQSTDKQGDHARGVGGMGSPGSMSMHPQPVLDIDRHEWTPGEIAALSKAKTGSNVFARQDAASSMQSGSLKASVDQSIGSPRP